MRRQSDVGDEEFFMDIERQIMYFDKGIVEYLPTQSLSSKRTFESRVRPARRRPEPNAAARVRNSVLLIYNVQNLYTVILPRSITTNAPWWTTKYEERRTRVSPNQ